MTTLITEAINSIWSGDEILSEEDNKAYISLIFKQGDTEDPFNYRPISVTNAFYRIMAKAVTNRMQHVISSIVEWNQSGFIKGRDIRANIFFISEGLKTFKKELLNSQNGDLFKALISLDFKKAYDSIDRKFIIALLEKANFPVGVINFVKSSFSNTTSCFKLPDGSYSEFFAIERGVKQGDPLSPLLFAIVTEPLRQAIQQLRNGGFSIDVNEQIIKILILLYADDMVLFSSDNEILNVLKDFGFTCGLELSIIKCMQLNFNNESINLFDLTDDIKILGCFFTNYSINRELLFNKLLEKFKVAILLLKRSWIANSSVFTRATAYKVFVQAILNYYFNFILLTESEAKEFDKIAIDFINVGMLPHDIIFLDTYSGGLGVTRTLIRNMAIQAHWIIRANYNLDNNYSRYWAAVFNQQITEAIRDELTVSQIENTIVRNAVIAWDYL